jgi:hypothetical protein
MFLKQVCVSCVDERKILRSEEEKSNIESFVFSRRIKRLDRRHLLVLKLANENFKNRI